MRILIDISLQVHRYTINTIIILIDSLVWGGWTFQKGTKTMKVVRMQDDTRWKSRAVWIGKIAGILGILTLAIVLIMAASPLAQAAPCGTPKSGPCPTATPTSIGGPTATPTSAPTATPTPAPTPTSTTGGGGWTLVWSDEFSGSTLNSANWTYDIGWGTNGWGNLELQSYTDKSTNVRLENGELVIEARKERVKGQQYTSGRIKTQGLREFTYGRIEARMKIPYGQGIWPAFWTLGNDIETAGWPQSGEIDIMENIGSEPNILHGTVHGPGYSGANGVGGSYTLSSGALSDAYHVYAVEWTATSIKWYIDNTLYATVTPNDVPGQWVFDHPFFIILNVAVGGYWPGDPDATTVFPQQLRVDYVRVYQ